MINSMKPYKLTKEQYLETMDEMVNITDQNESTVDICTMPKN